jgi:hypothetical protein
MDITKRTDDADLLKFHDLIKNYKWREIGQSVKLHYGTVNKNRMLYGMGSSSVRYKDVVRTLTELNFPFEKFPLLESYYYESLDLGFALEKSSSGELNYRVYFEKNYSNVEMNKTIDKMIESNNDHLYPIINGIKWNIDSPEKAVVTEYQCMVNYTAAALIRRMVDKGAYLPQSIRQKFLRSPNGVYIYRNYRPLEAYESTTRRHSFDISFEKNSYSNKDFCSSEIDSEFKVNSKEALAEFDEYPIAHVATGKDKDDRSFITVYYLIN